MHLTSDILFDVLHHCDHTFKDSAHWCDGKEEHITVVYDKKGYWLYAPWDQKEMDAIMEQLNAQLLRLA